MFTLPPGTVDSLPLAVLLSPPPTVALVSLAVLKVPPPTVALVPLAVLASPPPRVDETPLAVLVLPPPTVDESLPAVLLVPPPTVPKLSVTLLTLKDWPPPPMVAPNTPAVVHGGAIGLCLALQYNTPIAAKVVAASNEEGLLLNPVRPDAIRFMPPLIVTEAEVDVAMAKLDRGLARALSS